MHRYPSSRPLDPQPRTSVHPSTHRGIDAALKQLKSHSKRLKACLESFVTEQALLERLYYKGNNQHGASLYWRRVDETRRYGRRIRGSGMLDTVQDLHYAFFGSSTEPSAKVLRGSWTHVPTREHILSAGERVQGCILLLIKTRERLTATERYLLQTIKTGAFLQHSLTLTAIVSRMDLLAQELSDILSPISTICAELGALVETPPEGADIKNLDNGALESSQHRETSPVTGRGTATEPAIADASDVGPDSDIVQAPEPTKLFAFGPGQSSTKVASEAKVLANTVAPSSKKKSKKRDVLDDIFGF